jgi:hypothetical protein
MGFRDCDGKKVVLRGMSTGSPQDSFGQEDGEDIHTWGDRIFPILLDHYMEGFIGLTIVSYRDQEFVGTTSTGFWVNSTKETT